MSSLFLWCTAADVNGAVVCLPFLFCLFVSPTLCSELRCGLNSIPPLPRLQADLNVVCFVCLTSSLLTAQLMYTVHKLHPLNTQLNTQINTARYTHLYRAVRCIAVSHQYYSSSLSVKVVCMCEFVVIAASQYVALSACLCFSSATPEYDFDVVEPPRTQSVLSLLSWGDDVSCGMLRRRRLSVGVLVRKWCHAHSVEITPTVLYAG